MPLKIDMDKSPKAQLEALRNRQKLITTSKWNELEKEAHDKAFTVAKVMSADVLQDIYDYVQTAVKEGLSYKSFKDRVRNGGLVERMQNAGWLKTATDKQISARLQVIIDTNVKMAYGKGNYNRLMLVKDKKPYWIYHQVERKTKRAEHSIYNGRKFHCDDPIWNTIYPPSGFRCSCWVEAVAEPDGVESGSNIEINPDEHPISPLSVWKPETTKYIEGIGKALEGTLRMKKGDVFDDKWLQDFLEAEDDWDKWHDLDCDLTNKPRFSSIDDAIRFNKEEIQEYISGCSIPVKGQSTWQDYGLKDDSEIVSERENKLELNNRILNSITAFNYLYYTITKGHFKDRIIQTPLQRIKITTNVVKHLLFDKNGRRDDHREQYADFVLPTLESPQEIWLAKYRNKDSSAVVDKVSYIRRYNVFVRDTVNEWKVKTLSSVVSKTNKESEFIVTFMIDNERTVKLRRQGKLLYIKKDLINNLDSFNLMNKKNNTKPIIIK